MRLIDAAKQRVQQKRQEYAVVRGSLEPEATPQRGGHGCMRRPGGVVRSPRPPGFGDSCTALGPASPTSPHFPGLELPPPPEWVVKRCPGRVPAAEGADTAGDVATAGGGGVPPEPPRAARDRRMGADRADGPLCHRKHSAAPAHLLSRNPGSVPNQMIQIIVFPKVDFFLHSPLAWRETGRP